MLPTPELVLASASPRRRELLRMAGIPFRVVVRNAPREELPKTTTKPGPLVEKLALEKAQAVAETAQGLILGADTIVVAGKDILGKPADRAEAAKMLARLSGASHKVYTGLALIDNRTDKEKVLADHEKTEVTFRRLSKAEIEWYVSTGEVFGKAGAYAIQGRGSLLVSKISGCYFNVVGLPLGRLAKLLANLGPLPWELA
jgi:septum formation protein